MSRRYSMEERVWMWSSEYVCKIEIIPNREITYHYDPPKPRHYQKHVTKERIKIISDFLRHHASSTVNEICTGCNMGKSTVRNVFDQHPNLFQARPVERKKRQINVWSLKN